MKLNVENIQLIKDDLSDELLKTYSSKDLLSVDCEMMGLNPNRDRLCLIQMCNEDGTIALVKVENHSIKSKAPNLKKLFEDDKVRKIFHFGRTDLAFLYQWLDIDLKNVFCTKAASKLVRTFTDRHSLKDLVRDLLNSEMDKSSQSTDWGAPELTREQIKYAAYDVVYLIPLYRKLIELLKRENRLEIAEEACRFLPTLSKLDIWGYEDFFAH